MYLPRHCTDSKSSSIHTYRYTLQRLHSLESKTKESGLKFDYFTGFDLYWDLLSELSICLTRLKGFYRQSISYTLWSLLAGDNKWSASYSTEECLKESMGASHTNLKLGYLFCLTDWTCFRQSIGHILQGPCLNSKYLSLGQRVTKVERSFRKQLVGDLWTELRSLPATWKMKKFIAKIWTDAFSVKIICKHTTLA